MKTSSNNIPARGDVYERVTNKIIADLEAGIRPWLKPWSGENIAAGIPLRHFKKPLNNFQPPAPFWPREIAQPLNPPNITLPLCGFGYTPVFRRVVLETNLSSIYITDLPCLS